jgi:23S rRNA (cytosine1962-C5)-methyltransferase
MRRIDYSTDGWEQYYLIDSGEGRKLEQFGAILLDRPDPQALWRKKNPSLWNEATAQFLWTQSGEKWKKEKTFDGAWELCRDTLCFSLSLSKFKHIGLFPEHESQWKELSLLCKEKKGVSVLNLFGYTGAASLSAAVCGAKVTHVDASKQTIATVKRNVELSGLPSGAIRCVCEDALKYAKRLVQRGETFDVILLDPPAFGRGPKGEIWKIEEKLSDLLLLLPALLSKDAHLVVLNGYAAGYSARTFGELLQDVFVGFPGEVTYGDVGIQQKNSNRILSTGIYAAWRRRKSL